MSTAKTATRPLRYELALDVVSDHFGGNVETVFRHLMIRGPVTFPQLRTHCHPMTVDMVRNCLAVLCQHGLCDWTTTSRNHKTTEGSAGTATGEDELTAVVRYTANVTNAVRRIRLPAFLARAEERCGRFGELALEILVEYGVARADAVVQIAVERCAAARGEEAAARAGLGGGGGQFGAGGQSGENEMKERDRVELKRAMRALASAHYVTRAMPQTVSTKGEEHDVVEIAAGDAEAEPTVKRARLTTDAPVVASAPSPEISAARNADDQQEEEGGKKGKKSKRQSKRKATSRDESERPKKKRARKGSKKDAEQEEEEERGKSKKKKDEEEEEEAAAAAENIPEHLMLIAGKLPTVAKAAKPSNDDAGSKSQPKLFEGTLDLPMVVPESCDDNEGGLVPQMEDIDLYEGSCLWRPNMKQFLKDMKEKAVLDFVAKKLDPLGAQIVKVMLRTTRGGQESVEINDLLSALHRDQKATTPSAPLMTLETLRTWLEILCKDKTQIVEAKINPHDRTMMLYSVLANNVVQALRMRAIESVVHDKFGNTSLRIFRLLAMKRLLENKQVAELAMIPGKETKVRLATMMSAGYVKLQEVPKSLATKEPTKSFWLWGVDYVDVEKLVLDELDAAMLNLRLRAAHEVSEVRHIIPKTMRSDRGEMLTKDERDQWAAFLQRQDRLEISVTRIDEMSALLREFSSL